MHLFIARDESYILFDAQNHSGGRGQEDLRVCFRKPDGSWSEAQNLGEAVNTPNSDWTAFVSPDGKYIFYSTNEDICWVSAKILHPLKAKALGSSGPSK